MLNIPNGVPRVAMKQLRWAPPIVPDHRGRLRVLVLGNSGREEAVGLLEALSQLRQPTQLTYAGLQGDLFVGFNRENHRLLGLLSQTRALAEIPTADVLAIPQSPDRIGRLSSTSKIPEFMASGRPILIANPQQNDLLILHRYYGDHFAVIEPGASTTAWRRGLEWADGRKGLSPSPEQRDEIMRVFDRDTHARIVHARIEAVAE